MIAPAQATIHQLFPKHTVVGWDWQSQAACQGSDTESFYHPENERGSSKTRRINAAKRVCAQCPVMANCLRQALAVREPYGIWGGTTVEEREQMLATRDSQSAQSA